VGNTPVNPDTLSADYPSLAVAGQVPSVAFIGTAGVGNTGNVYTFFWNESTWQRVGSNDINQNTVQAARSPHLTQSLSNKTIVWVEDTGTTVQALYAKSSLSNSDWTAPWGLDALNWTPTQSVATPVIAGVFDASVQKWYVAWSEAAADVTTTASNVIYAKYWTQSGWEKLSGELNVNDKRFWEGVAPAICPMNSSTNKGIYLAWTEQLVLGTTLTASSKIYVKNQVMNAGWSLLGGCLNYDPTHSAQQPTVAAWQEQAVAAWSEYDGKSWKIYVKRWTGSAWQLLGSALNVDADMDASQPCIAAEGNTLAVIWKEQGAAATQVYAKYWDNQTWRPLGDGLNQSITSNAGNPQLQIDGGRLFVAWSEETSVGMSVYVKSWGEGLPLHYEVLPIYENRLRALGNKFNPVKGEACTLEWCLARNSNISITLYTLDGRKVRGLVRNQPFSGGGPYTLAWDGKNDQGSTVASGIYLALIEAGDFKKWAKIGVVK
jgi:hypothetical protein